MAALSNVHAASLLNTSLRSGTYYLALFLTDPTAAATGTEASGGGYVDEDGLKLKLSYGSDNKVYIECRKRKPHESQDAL